MSSHHPAHAGWCSLTVGESNMKELPNIHLRSIARHYLPPVRRHARAHIWMFAAYGAGTLLAHAAVPLVYKELMDTITESGRGGFDWIVQLLLLLTGAIIVYNIAFRIGDYLIIDTQSKILKDLSDDAIRTMQKKSYTFYTNSFSGGLVAKVKRYIHSFEELHDIFVFHIFMEGITLIAAVTVLWYFSWELGATFLVWLIGYALLIRYLVRWVVPKSLDMASQDSAVTARMSDVFTNMLTVKMFGAHTHEQDGYEEVTATQQRSRRASWMQTGFWNTLIQGATINAFEVLIVVMAVLLWKYEVASAGLVLLTVLYVLKSFGIVWQMSRTVVRATTAFTDANEMVEILDAPNSVLDPKEPEHVRIKEGQIRFENVSHSYENSTSLFTDFSLTVPAGEKVALVGHSGSGKTTVVKLLLRFVDVAHGSIVIDGQDIRHIKQNDLRKHIAYVPQDPSLFHRSIHDNIAYGRPGATRAEVVEVAKRAHADHFIRALPHGYDTLVGERGVKLSGGERQRVAIARAMLKEVPIVVLDEATSSLDSESERHIQAAFDELMRGRTTIVIAHRLSTIQHMNRIVVLQAGQIIEDGAHAALLAQNGVYARLWHNQVAGFVQDEGRKSA
jgi:ATP-binding cassette subfamily B protein